MSVHAYRTALTFIALALLAGCKKQEAVVSYSVPKTPHTTEADGDSGPTIAGMTYTKPTGWKTAQPNEFEAARFDVDGDKTAFATVSRMGSQFDLQPNVERWEGQVGIKAVTPEFKDATVGGIAAKSLDLQGKEKSLVVAVVPKADGTMIFKLLGPTDKVESARPAFDAFLQSIQFENTTATEQSTPAPAPSPSPTAAENTGLPFTFTAPPDWTLDPNPRPMRLATWTAGAGNDRAEIFISGPINSAGFDVASNVDRWRKQVDLGPAGTPADVKSTDVKFADATGKLVDVAGPTKRLIVAYGGQGDLWFFKMQGTTAAVAAQKPAFDKFLASVKFNP